MIIGLFLDGPMKGMKVGLKDEQRVLAVPWAPAEHYRYIGIPMVFFRHGRWFTVMLFREEYSDGRPIQR